MIYLAILSFLLVGLLAWEKYQSKIERQKFINALISRNAKDLVQIEMADKETPETTNSEPSFDELYTEARELSDEDHAMMVEKELERFHGS